MIERFDYYCGGVHNDWKYDLIVGTDYTRARRSR
jgi:hypothetical protein